MEDAHKLLSPLLGSKLAPVLFAVALIAAGQSSTVTGTLAGQIVMEGYLRLRINPVVRRLITRLLAIIPTLLVILIAGEKMITNLLILSQVLLSMQLAFAVIPLIHFVSDRKKMGIFTISVTTKIAAWIVAALIVGLNMQLFLQSVGDWLKAANNPWLQGLIMIFVILVAVILLITILYPLMLKRRERNISVHETIPSDLLVDNIIKPFTRIALALDYSDNDQQIMRYALQLANPQTTFILIHVVESVSARMMGNEADDYETRKDQDHLDEYVTLLRSHNYEALGILGFKDRTSEIARIIKENNCDLLIIGSHGHNTAKDWLFGETINSVRHMISIPVFIAR